jgi:phosphatidate cytidylyltransferase
VTAAAPRIVRFADLGLRLASGLALAVIAVIDIWAGGAWAAAFIAVILVLMLWEYHRMVTGDGRVAAPGFLVAAVAGIAAIVATAIWGATAGMATLAVGAVAVAVAARRWPGWLAAGYLYMGLAMGALIVLRAKEPEGVWLILWLVLVVVAADVGAYFVGRSVGGPKLWSRVSPGKTWSGAVGGLAAAGLAGLVFGMAVGWNAVWIGGLSLGIAVFSQLGDLLESAVKRRFGVKDASALIPGHGGVMDRLDGVMGGVWFFGVCDALGLGVLGP